MDVLILGGSGFIGRHLVQALLASGQRVSVLSRGQTPDVLPAAVERLRGDRDLGAAGLQALAGRCWQACVDISGYTPAQVRPSAELLRARVGRYVFVSAVMAYGDPQQRPVRESQPRLPPAAEAETDINGQTYGPLKVACEDLVQQIWGAACTLLRPQVIVGPQDPTLRYTHWVQRASLGGPMLAPGDGSDHLQVIDVRDVAAFTARVIEHELSGAFNLAGPRLTWADFMRLLGVADPVWVDATILQAAQLDFNELPLYRPERGVRASLMDVSSERAQAAGLVLSAPALTLQDVRAALAQQPVELAMSAQREAALIAVARQRGQDPRVEPTRTVPDHKA